MKECQKQNQLADDTKRNDENGKKKMRKEAKKEIKDTMTDSSTNH